MEKEMLGRVLFFNENETDDSLLFSGSSYTLPIKHAEFIYNNFPSMWSVLVTGFDDEEINEKVEEEIEKIKDPKYCQDNIWSNY